MPFLLISRLSKYIARIALGSLAAMRFFAVLSLPLSFGVTVLAQSTAVPDPSDACLSDAEVCSRLQPLISLLLGNPGVTRICKQVDPEARGPVVVTVTDQPQAIATTTVQRTRSQSVRVTSRVTKTITQLSTATVTVRQSSTAIRSSRVTVPATAVQTITTETIAYNIVPIVVTKFSTYTVTVTTTATEYSTEYEAIPPIKRDEQAGGFGILSQYPTDQVRDACWCLETDTVTNTVALPTSTSTKTVIASTAIVTVDQTTTQTIDASTQVVATATADVLSVITQTSLVTVTSTTTVSVYDTLTSSIAIASVSTLTKPVTVTATRTISTVDVIVVVSETP